MIWSRSTCHRARLLSSKKSHGAAAIRGSFFAGLRLPEKLPERHQDVGPLSFGDFRRCGACQGLHSRATLCRLSEFFLPFERIVQFRRKLRHSHSMRMILPTIVSAISRPFLQKSRHDLSKASALPFSSCLPGVKRHWSSKFRPLPAKRCKPCKRNLRA